MTWVMTGVGHLCWHDRSRSRTCVSLVNLVGIGLPLVGTVTNLELEEPFGVVTPDSTRPQDPFNFLSDPVFLTLKICWTSHPTRISVTYSHYTLDPSVVDRVDSLTNTVRRGLGSDTSSVVVSLRKEDEFLSSRFLFLL